MNQACARRSQDSYGIVERARYHVCIYLPSEGDFEAAFRRADAAGAVFVNQRFLGGAPEFSSAVTWAEANACKQFRIKDMRDPQSKRLVLALEHEVRSPLHRCCPVGKKAPHHEAAEGQLPSPPHVHTLAQR